LYRAALLVSIVPALTIEPIVPPVNTIKIFFIMLFPFDLLSGQVSQKVRTVIVCNLLTNSHINMKISLIVAMAKNRVIGDKGTMPWHLSADLKKFKNITTGFPIIMGRKTYQSIGKPLPNRSNIVISSNPDYKPDGCVVFNNIDSALTYACQLAEQVFIIGGSTLYQTLLPLTDTLYITQIHQNFAGDTWFPDFDSNDWLEIAREDINNDPSVVFAYSFLQLARNVSKANTQKNG
jgi:dihydrofolate reductase